MSAKQWNPREFQKLLRRNGYNKIKQNGSHQIWNDGNSSISIPTVKLNYLIAKRLIKENSLVI